MSTIYGLEAVKKIEITVYSATRGVNGSNHARNPLRLSAFLS